MNADEWERGPTVEVSAFGAPRAERVEPAMWPVAAALLNLTGLQLAYLHLERWWRAALHTAAGAGLIVLAFWTGAADRPWLWRAVAVLWLGWLAYDGWRLASPTPHDRLSRGLRRVPAVVGAALVGVLLAGYLGYGAAARGTYQAGLAAESRGDCTTAIARYDTLTSRFELTLSPTLGQAEQRRPVCREFLRAALVEAGGNHPAAARAFVEFRRGHPQSPLVPHADERLEGVYREWAAQQRAAGDHEEAIRIYRLLLVEADTDSGRTWIREQLAVVYFEQVQERLERLPSATGDRLSLATVAVESLVVIATEFGSTSTAAQVPQAMRDTYTAAKTPFTERRFCDALPVLDYFAGLTGQSTAEVGGRADADRPLALFECGLGLFRAGNFEGAISPLETMIADYPADPGIPQARSAIIAARVAVANGAPVPLPAPLGGNSPGTVELTYYNTSQDPARILVSGPTAHEIVIPPCPNCAPLLVGAPDDCEYGADRPSVTLRLQPGVYEDLLVGGRDVDGGDRGPRVIEPGFYYWDCVVTRIDGVPPLQPG